MTIHDKDKVTLANTVADAHTAMSIMVAVIEALIAQYPIGEMAELLGVERTTLWRWRNFGYPHTKTLAAVHEAINAGAAWPAKLLYKDINERDDLYACVIKETSPENEN